MIVSRPPSLQREYNAFWSQDTAIVPRPDDEQKDELAAWEDKIERARETGNWDEVVIPGETPTTFVLRPISTREYAVLHDMINSRGGLAEIGELAFRVALVRVTDLVGPGPVKLKKDTHPSLGFIPTTSFFDEAGLDAIVGQLIAQELGGLAMQRASRPPPKR